jgi:hypothetical protein
VTVALADAAAGGNVERGVASPARGATDEAEAASGGAPDAVRVDAAGSGAPSSALNPGMLRVAGGNGMLRIAGGDAGGFTTGILPVSPFSSAVRNSRAV